MRLGPWLSVEAGWKHRLPPAFSTGSSGARLPGVCERRSIDKSLKVGSVVANHSPPQPEPGPSSSATPVLKGSVGQSQEAASLLRGHHQVMVLWGSAGNERQLCGNGHRYFPQAPFALRRFPAGQRDAANYLYGFLRQWSGKCASRTY